MDFDQTWYILKSFRESETLLIFKVKGQGHRVNFLPNNILVNTLESTSFKLGTYLVLKRIWNPIDFQGHRSKVKITRSNFEARGYATLCVAFIVISGTRKTCK